MGQVLLLSLLQIAGAGLAIRAGLGRGLACAVGLPLGLALWVAAVAFLTAMAIPWSAALTLAPAGLAAAVGLALAARSGRARAVAAVLASAAVVAGVAALAVRGGILALPPVGHDALLGAQMPDAASAGPDLAPGARFLVFLERAAASLGAPLATATGPVAAMVTAALVAAAGWRRPALALCAAAALLSLHAYARQATTFDVSAIAAMFLVGFAVIHTRAEERDDARALPIECALLFGAAVQQPAFTWITAVMIPVVFRADRRLPQRIAAWLGVLATALAWWHVNLMQLAPTPEVDAPSVDRPWLAIAPLAAVVVWLATRAGSRRGALAGAGLLLAVTALVERTEPATVWAGLRTFASIASPSLALLLLLALAAAIVDRRARIAGPAVVAMACALALHLVSDAPLPDPAVPTIPAALFVCIPLLLAHLVTAATREPAAAATPAAPAPWLAPVGGFQRGAARLFAAALVVTILANPAQQVRQHRRLEVGRRLIDPGPTRRAPTRLDLMDWIDNRTSGGTAVIPARIDEQAVLFRHLAEMEVVLADPAPQISATAAFELFFRGDSYKSLHFRSTQRRVWVVAFAGRGATRFVLAESPLLVLFWMPEELYLEAGGRPLQ